MQVSVEAAVRYNGGALSCREVVLAWVVRFVSVKECARSFSAFAGHGHACSMSANMLADFVMSCEWVH